jgi:hypothetical protein
LHDGLNILSNRDVAVILSIDRACRLRLFRARQDSVDDAWRDGHNHIVCCIALREDFDLEAGLPMGGEIIYRILRTSVSS